MLLKAKTIEILSNCQTLGSCLNNQNSGYRPVIRDISFDEGGIVCILQKNLIDWKAWRGIIHFNFPTLPQQKTLVFCWTETWTQKSTYLVPYHWHCVIISLNSPVCQRQAIPILTLCICVSDFHIYSHKTLNEIEKWESLGNIHLLVQSITIHSTNFSRFHLHSSP